MERRMGLDEICLMLLILAIGRANQPFLGLQRGGLPFSLRHDPALVSVALQPKAGRPLDETCGYPSRLAATTLLYAVWTFLPAKGGLSSSFLGMLSVSKN